MNQMLNKAICIATKVHDGQYDKGGNPYILHCLKVMHYLKTDDEELMCIAVLHDSVEDGDITIDELYCNHGQSLRVVEAVDCLTKKVGQSPEEYLYKIMSNVDAMKVKLCDLRHNMDVRRLKGLREKDAQRMAKYAHMYVAITNELKETGEI